MPGSRPEGDPGTHYGLFAGLRGAGVSFLVGGAAALVLHGVPRLTPDIELAADPDPANVARLERFLSAAGYGEVAAPLFGADGETIKRFRHSSSPLSTIDVLLPSAAEFARLRAGAAGVNLVDLDLPLVGAHDLRARLERSGAAADREDAASLRLVAALRAGDRSAGDADETRLEQIRKFSRWSVAARLDWLLAAARLDKGMAPEAKPMTRGLVRRRGWFGASR
jgi:hypothetical protein